MSRPYIFLLGIVIATCPLYMQASDTDAPPFMIYIDPETGKYTKTRPGHETTPQQSQVTGTASNMTRSDPPAAQLITAFLIAGGLLLSSYLLSRILVSYRK